MSSFLWLAAVTGALSLLTPCVFPMIPITVTWFNQIADSGRGRVIRNAVLFAGLPFAQLGSSVRYDLAEVEAFIRTKRRLSSHIERQQRRKALALK